MAQIPFCKAFASVESAPYAITPCSCYPRYGPNKNMRLWLVQLSWLVTATGWTELHSPTSSLLYCTNWECNRHWIVALSSLRASFFRHGAVFRSTCCRVAWIPNANENELGRARRRPE
ncbi:hypothetical protein JG687_00006915 [Phytophthora cactorum]|uniref:Uncharacterized protein n=1 Tax=Phytophthora cactorum TaxID=29920 RepID=A0A8T1UJR7_9STRA|nr:hypothetical protein JG687_00006915 [Phytophthora cactorum]